MTDTKTIEREYVIPLRKHWLKAAKYKRARKAVKAIKQFIAKHMKVPDRDDSKVRLDVYLNNEIWFRGKQNPPAKVKVKAVKEGDIVRVGFAEMPEHIAFLRQKIEKRHTKAEKKVEIKHPEKTEEKTEEQKTDEKEKEKAVALQHEKQLRQEAKAQKHTIKSNEPKIQRKALKK
jgi:large subunit ribosomal protein L31e